MLTTVNGLVIRLFPTGDHDTILHILTEDRGRISVMVKGAQPPWQYIRTQYAGPTFCLRQF